MSFITKVVFPVPPPTTNDLSSHQRTQLLRKAKKLEQIFGATPSLVDNNLESGDPIHIAFPKRPSQHRPTRTFRESFDSISSTSSSVPSASCKTHSIRSINSSRATTPVNPINTSEIWPGKVKSPVMRLFMKSPTLETIPASPSPSNMNFPCQPPMNRASDVLFTQFIPEEEDTSLRNMTNRNSFNITSLSSLRKQKMDRLRRKLGQDVPFDLVFPSSPSESSDSDSGSSITPDLSVDVIKVLPPPPLRRKPSGRLSTSRDSIADSASVHRAKRQAQLSVSRSTLRDSRSGSALSEPKKVTQRLSFIIESPDEHGIGCAEEFGQSPKPEQKFKSEWTVSTGAAEVKLWSTRRGYEGWHSKSPSNTLQTPSLFSPPPPPSLPSNTELKKKPSSYRKPVPPISIDCY